MEERKRLSLYEKAPQMMRDMVSGLAGDCPFLLSLNSGIEACVLLVSSLSDGSAYGFTLEYYRNHKGAWYRFDGRDPFGKVVWKHTEEPFTGVDNIIAAEKRKARLSDALTPYETDLLKSKSSINTDSHILSGKYRDRTVGDVIREDEQYFRWAIEGLKGFSEIAFK